MASIRVLRNVSAMIGGAGSRRRVVISLRAPRMPLVRRSGSAWPDLDRQSGRSKAPGAITARRLRFYPTTATASISTSRSSSTRRSMPTMVAAGGLVGEM